MADNRSGAGSPEGRDAADAMTVDDLVWFMFGRFVEGDLRTVEELAAAAAQTFGDIADDLARVPEPLRDDETHTWAWAEFATTLARMLSAHGDTRLAERLLSPEDNPINRWQDALERAQRLRADGRFVETDEVLTDVLDGLRTMRGTAVDALLGKALGTAAANAFDLGRLDDALRLTDEALRECERTGDTEGVATYSANLATVGSLAAAPHREIRRRIARAQELHDDGRLDEAFAQVAEVMNELDAADEPELVAAYGAKARGLLGMVCYRRGDLAAARSHTAAALDLGHRHGDRAAVAVYEANLAVVDRAMGGASGEAIGGTAGGPDGADPGG